MGCDISGPLVLTLIGWEFRWQLQAHWDRGTLHLLPAGPCLQLPAVGGGNLSADVGGGCHDSERCCVLL